MPLWLKVCLPTIIALVFFAISFITLCVIKICKDIKHSNKVIRICDNLLKDKK